jgi:branched-chain amino acid aminotransferase
MPITPTAQIWMNGALVPWDDAKIHVLNPTLHYGWGVFEGIRAYRTPQGTAVFRLTDHVRRLLDSARIYLLDVPYDEAALVAACKEVVRVNAVDECYLRPIVYLGYGEMGLNPLPSHVEVAIACWPWGRYLGDAALETGCRVAVSSWRRIEANTIPPAGKGTGQYVNSSLAKVTALKAGYDEALLTTPDGKIAEGSGENLFLVKGGRLLTPPTIDGVLEGITRDSVMTLARDLGLEVVERSLTRSDVYLADEAFFTGTAAEVVPIASVDDRPVGDGRPGPVTKDLVRLYGAAVRGEVEPHKDWCELVA